MLIEDLSFVLTITHLKDGVPVNSDNNRHIYLSDEIKDLDMTNLEVPLETLYRKLDSMISIIGAEIINKSTRVINTDYTITKRERFIVNNFANDFSKLAGTGIGEEYVITFLARDIIRNSVANNNGTVIAFLVQEDDDRAINDYISNVVFYDEDIIYRASKFATTKKIAKNAAVLWTIFDLFQSNTLNEELVQNYIPTLKKLGDKMNDISKKCISSIRSY